MKYIFFDTETTGVPRNYNAPISDVENWPRLVQLGFIVYEDNKKIHEAEYIIKPDGFEISEEVSKVHGITQEIADDKGFPVKKVILEFATCLNGCDKIVGHNIDFDIKILGAEYHRIYGNDLFATRDSICTMKSSTGYCKIPGSYGKYKWPKLHELYKTLFNEDMGAAHTALQDIQNTAKCFFELQRLGVLYS